MFLLRETDRSVTDICLDVGFSSLGTFSRTFKEIVGESPLGLPFRRVLGFRGRSDNMVTLRGINVYPTGSGALLTAERPEFAGEDVCEVERMAGREEMTVRADGSPAAPGERTSRNRAQPLCSKEPDRSARTIISSARAEPVGSSSPPMPSAARSTPRMMR